jgi:hypothetical protein
LVLPPPISATKAIRAAVLLIRSAACSQFSALATVPATLATTKRLICVFNPTLSLEQYQSLGNTKV